MVTHKLTKTITESDNNLFCLLTLNHHPVHSNIEYARKAKHGRILVVGTYVLSLVVGISVEDISINAVANLEFSNVKHHAPVFIGDTLRAQSTFNDEGRIRNVFTEAYNQHDELVLSFHRKVLMK